MHNHRVYSLLIILVAYILVIDGFLTSTRISNNQIISNKALNNNINNNNKNNNNNNNNKYNNNRLFKLYNAVSDELKDTASDSSSSSTATEKEMIDYGEIPSKLPSEMGVDYIPLATSLSLGNYEEADQITRDNLIKIAGSEAVRRNFVYWTEVKNIPSVDFCTMERLWLQFTGGTQGYSVQKRVWEFEKGNFDRFIRRIGWTTIENGEERKLKWFTTPREFIYEDMENAPKGHLPLTSALRGTQLMKAIMEHPVWTDYDWKNYQDLEW